MMSEVDLRQFREQAQSTSQGSLISSDSSQGTSSQLVPQALRQPGHSATRRMLRQEATWMTAERRHSMEMVRRTTHIRHWLEGAAWGIGLSLEDLHRKRTREKAGFEADSDGADEDWGWRGMNDDDNDVPDLVEFFEEQHEYPNDADLPDLEGEGDDDEDANSGADGASIASTANDDPPCCLRSTIKE